MNPLKALFLDELADCYDAEKQLVRALPGLARAATCPELQKLLQSHFKETQEHVKQLETVFQAFKTKPAGKKCAATAGLLVEADALVATFKQTPALNAALIAAAQKIEHYEMASYACLSEWAMLLGRKDAAGVLKEILAEEKAAQQGFIGLARLHANREALGGGDGEAPSTAEGKTSKAAKSRRGMGPISLGPARSVMV